MPIKADFDALESLREFLAAIRRSHVASMAEYVSRDGKGFCHQITKKETASLASTATCLTALVDAGEWNRREKPIWSSAANVAAFISSKRTSSGLPENNPFSLSFVVEGLLDLASAVPDYSGRETHSDLVKNGLLDHLLNHLTLQTLDKPAGSIAIDPYPPSAYLTQLVHRVLKRCQKLGEEHERSVYLWSSGEINKQMALITANSRVADPLQLAYALILAVSTVPDERTSPEHKEIAGHALKLFFEQQNEDGSWPLSRPMFHYKEVGSAYYFEYELLAQLLKCAPLRDDLLGYLPQLERAARLTSKTGFDLDPNAPGRKIGWASGHHPQLQGPESWSTASVYHFANALDRLVAEGIRIALFHELRNEYTGVPLGANKPPADGTIKGFADTLLDADLCLNVNDPPQSLKEVLARSFVFPIAKDVHLVRSGGRLGDDTPNSAILFGPPGTSKTDLAKHISAYLGWPLLQVDPSYLVKEGLDQIQALANRLFTMLTATEEVVVLLDEFDEMGRNRAGNENLLSRFITTAMLPKLVAINKAKKIVFLLATNYVSGFDAAFSRGGRFDMVLQVMQPNLRQKLGFEPWAETLNQALEKLDDGRAEAERQLDELTFLETKALVAELGTVNDAQETAKVIETAHQKGTLSRDMDADHDLLSESRSKTDQGEHLKRTWGATSIKERALMRIPTVRSASAVVVKPPSAL